MFVPLKNETKSNKQNKKEVPKKTLDKELNQIKFAKNYCLSRHKIKWDKKQSTK